jgi:translation initiation factor 2-alpha kinase 4
MVLNRVPAEIRPAIVEILQQSKSSSSQKKALMHKKGLARSVIEELDTVNESDTNIDAIISRIERTSPTLALHVSPFFQEIKETLSYVSVLNVSTPVVIHPLLLGKDTYFKDGVCFEIIRRKKRTDILASGGRYDSLLASLIPPNQKGPENLPVCAVGVQIAVDKIVAALAQFQSTSVKTLVSQQRSFGYWSPRRCDVYVVSYQPGLIQERLEVAALLWQHGISADVMYESGLPDTEQENHLDMCTREGIL